MKIKLILFALIALSNIYGCQNTEIVHAYVYKNVPKEISLNHKQLSYILALSLSCAQDNKHSFVHEKYELGDILFFKLHNPFYSCFLFFNSTTRNCMIQCVSYDNSFDYTAFKRVVDFFLINY
jgi:hypothetical protein